MLTHRSANIMLVVALPEGHASESTGRNPVIILLCRKVLMPSVMELTIKCYTKGVRHIVQ